MGKNHLNRSAVPQHSSGKKTETKLIRKDPTIMAGWQKDGDNANVFVSLRFIQYQSQCFSDWTAADIKAFWKFQEELHNTTWLQVYQSASKGAGKTGLAYTLIPSSKYPNQDFIKKLDPETTFFEVRVSGEMRVHGFRDKSVFYICWLDRGHDICK